MRRLIKYIKPYMLWALAAPLLMTGEVVVDLLQPKFMSTIVNEGVIGGDMQVILRTGLIMLITVLAGAFFGAACTVTASIASQSFGNDLRIDAYSRVMSLSVGQTDKFSTGSLVTRMTSDITMIQQFVAMALRMFIRAPLFFIGGIVMVVAISYKFGLILLAAVPIQIAVIAVILKKANPLFSKVQEKLDRVNAVVQENVGGARVIKAYVNEEYETERFGRANTELKTVNLRVLLLMSVIQPVFMIVMNAVILGVIAIGGLEINAAAIENTTGMQAGDVMAGISYITQILHSMIMASMIFQNWSRANASSKRINEVLECAPEITDGPCTPEKLSGHITMKDVSFRYPGASGTPVLTNIALDIKPGEFVAVVGATGSGKTSLVNLISRFYDADSGEVEIDGKNIKEYNLHALRSQIGYVLQKSELFSGSVADNIRWGKPDATDEEVSAAARTAQADGFICGFNDGYNTAIAEKGASLSGGQKQRLAIARALIRRPAILVLDDSTSALDLSTEAELQRALRGEMQGMTVIVVAQRISSVRRADRIAVIENGTVTAFAPHEELVKTSSAYRDIYNSQMRNGGGADEQ